MIRNWAFFLLTILFLLPGVAKGAEQEVNWLHDLRPGLEQAARDGIPVMVDVWAVWCLPCKAMDDSTYRDPRVLELSGELVPVKIDADVKTSFLERYRVDAFPTLLVLDHEGRELTRREGMVGPDEMVDLLSTVNSGYAHYRSGLESENDLAALDHVVNYLVTLDNPETAVDHLKRSLKQAANAEPAHRQGIQLLLAETQLETGQTRAASKQFARVAAEPASPELESQALAGVVRCERKLGRPDRVGSALEKLKAEFPEVADGLTSAR